MKVSSDSHLFPHHCAWMFVFVAQRVSETHRLCKYRVPSSVTLAT